MSALKKQPQADEVTVRDYIEREYRKVIAKQSNRAGSDIPGLVADRVARAMSPAEKIATFDAHLRELVRNEVKRIRNRHVPEDDSSASRGGRVNQRWVATPFDKAVECGSVWKTLGELTVADCDLAIDSYAARIRGNQVSLDRFAGLRDLLVSEGVSKAAELPESALLELGF